MGQFAGGDRVEGGEPPNNQPLNQNSPFAQLVHQEFVARACHTSVTPCPFKIGREVAEHLDENFGIGEEHQIVEALVQACRQIRPCTASLQGLCRLVSEDKLPASISEKREVRDALLGILTQYNPQTAEVFANHIFCSNKNPENLPELFILWPDNISQEAWDNVGSNLGLGKTNRPLQEGVQRADIKRKIIAAFKTLTGHACRTPDRGGDLAGLSKIFLREDEAKAIIYKVLSLPVDSFEKDGTSVRWSRNSATLERIANFVRQWESGSQADPGDVITDSVLIENRKNNIRGIEGFVSLPERTKSDILDLANLIGPEICRNVKLMIKVFELGYKEEDQAISLLQRYGFGHRTNREITRSDPGSITDQRGYDIAVGKNPNIFDSYAYYDVKSSQNGVSRQLNQNAHISGKQQLPACLQELEVEKDTWRVVWRATPLCFRNTDGSIVDNPAEVFYQAEQIAYSQLDKLLQSTPRR